MHIRTAGLGLALAFVSGAAQVRAQDITIGIKGGVTIADLAGPNPVEPEASNSRTAFGMGLYVELGIGDVWAIQPEVLYVQKGATDKEEGVELTSKFSYIEVPLLLKARLSPKGGVVRPSVYAGPVIAFETKCEIESRDASASVALACDAFNEASGGEVGLQTKSVEFGVALGTSLDVPAGPVILMGDVRYTIGLTDINDRAGAEKSSIKNRTWAIFLGVGFPLGS